MEKSHTTANETPRNHRVPPPSTDKKDLKVRKHEAPTETSGHVKETKDGTIEENQEEQAP